MKPSAVRFLVSIVIVCLCYGCANIVPPEGGKKDVTPPKIKSIEPGDSLLNTRVTKIEMHFNEYVTVDNAATEVQVSPLLPFPISVLGYGKRVVIKIPDSLLQENTTYRVSMGKAIKDLHEGNPLKPYTYVFSTGSYFDSLKVGGKVYDAATGLPYTDGVVVLYNASKSDSVVVKEKPIYITKIGTDGSFQIDGLPKHAYRIYAMHDDNNNLIFDGKKEKIGFIDSVVRPTDSVANPIVLKVFEEISVDTALSDANGKKSNRISPKKQTDEKLPLVYTISIDTSNLNKRSLDITKPIILEFNRRVDTINKQRVFLSYDSLGIAMESSFDLTHDTAKKAVLHLTAPWKEDVVYTLRLLKGFAKDSVGAEVMPARFSFRTKNDDDYAKMELHLPAKYRSSDYLLMVCTETDTVYDKPVTDTVINLIRLKPGNYKMRVIVDKNHNGKWDTGDLLEKRQPEEVIPYTDPLQLKAGWSNIVDFEPVKKGKGKERFGASPEKRDKPSTK